MMAASIEQRKQPVQARSVARVERILDAAAGLIAEVGVEAAGTSGIAQRAKISLASLYRYFPNKAAVVRAVAERQLTKLDRYLEDFLVRFDLEDGVDRLLDRYAEFYRTEPGYAEIWSGMQVMPELAELDLSELRRNARRLADRAASRYPGIDRNELEGAVTMLTRACGAVLHLGMTMSETQAAAMLSEVKFMARTYIRERLLSARYEGQGAQH
ncbi:TetR family transcriptional regulator [Alkalilimnicola ehrlichii]|uniref:TetR family transcriptional regulator n=1 Tax=Alkalilimnicola ehrlichii TaxID=351052 RepID=A0A3E0WFU0_9GAMM|nr:TetR/AcrR family transcriptional regulator [Alkalilimnicola ehrlichii]RFA24714.1 TetR family transcriptional regulator [Alkalilimnicola ehrlichii]RFA31812.1 TetR family transcriptional regulator [Alkalilimnicola ehrlichii]